MLFRAVTQHIWLPLSSLIHRGLSNSHEFKCHLYVMTLKHVSSGLIFPPLWASDSHIRLPVWYHLHFNIHSTTSYWAPTTGQILSYTMGWCRTWPEGVTFELGPQRWGGAHQAGMGTVIPDPESTVWRQRSGEHLSLSQLLLPSSKTTWETLRG